MSSRFLWSAAVVTLATSSFALGVVPRASAQSVTALNGSYSGTYRCAQSVTNLTLTISVTSLGELSARATIVPSTGPRGQSYSYRLTGQYDARTAKFQLAPVAWDAARPTNVEMVGLNGTFDSNELTGAAIGTGCGTFQVERDRAESTQTAAPRTRPSLPPPPAAPPASPARPAASRTQTAATGRTFCHSDPKQPVVYVSSVFATQVAKDALELDPEDLVELGFVEIDFTEFLNSQYKYPWPEKVNEHGSDCIVGYRLSQALVQQERTTWVAAQRQAGKRLVETGWAPAAASTQPAPGVPPRGTPSQPATTTAGTRRSSPPTTSGNGSAGRTGPGAVLLKWHADKEQPQTVLKADPVFVNENNQVVFMEAVCAPNGASVNFKVFGKDGQTGPQFDHHDDPSGASKTEIVDIDVSVDGRSHVAKGFLPIVGDRQAVNNVGVLFYEPGIAVKTRGERQFAGRLGSSIDNITGGILAAQADAQIEEGLRTSAGPLADLVNARSIEMRVPILGARSKAAFELSPTTPLFRAFAERCYAKFGGASTSQPTAAPAVPAAPSRSRPASPAGTRRVR